MTHATPKKGPPKQGLQLPISSPCSSQRSTRLPRSSFTVPVIVPKMNLFYVLIVLALTTLCSSLLEVSEEGVISVSEVSNVEIWECFDVVKELEGSHGVELLVVKSKKHSFKFVLKKFPSCNVELLRLEKEVHSQIPNSSYFPKYHGSFITTDSEEGYLIMEFVDTKDLKDVILDIIFEHKFEYLQNTLIGSMDFIGAELAAAIQILHDNNIVHRDIKLENIIVDQSGHLKLIDFGHSIKLKDLAERMKAPLGTVQYIAPEMDSCNCNYNYQVDWYSYGVTMVNLINDYLKEDEKFYQRRGDILGKIRKIIGQQEYMLIEACTRVDTESRVKSLDCLKKFTIFHGINWEEMKKRNASPPGNLPSFSC